MKTVVALILAASAAFFTPASAQTFSARMNGDVVTLMSEQCLPKVKKHIVKTLHPLFLRSTAVVNGKKFEACWAPAGLEILVIFDDGEYAKFSSNIFKPDASL